MVGIQETFSEEVTQLRFVKLLHKLLQRLFNMWYEVMSLFYSSFLLQLLNVTSNPENSKSGTGVYVNLSDVNIKICETSSLFYPNSNPKLIGCYKKNSRGPCGEYMVFYPLEAGEDETVGECDCDREYPRTLIYHEETHRCYPIFQQGYCSDGNWLDLTPSGMPVCTPNPCYQPPTNSQNTEDLVLMNGECVKVGEISMCSSTRFVVGFESTKRQPTCIRRPGGRSIGVIPLKCRPGTFRAVSGRCQPTFKFEF